MMMPSWRRHGCGLSKPRQRWLDQASAFWRSRPETRC